MAEKRTVLYRLYAADGRLLYVGITDDVATRFSSHRKEKRWWPEVAGKTLWWYDERGVAEEAELAAICGEDPVHNIRDTPRHAEAARAARRRRSSSIGLSELGLLSGEPLLFGGEPEPVRAYYRALIQRRLDELQRPPQG